MKKALKVFMVLIMISGITFSVLNIISTQTKALNLRIIGLKGSWVFTGNEYTCMWVGNDCEFRI